MKAPVPFHLAADTCAPQIMAGFRAYQVQYVDRLRQANGLDLARASLLRRRVVDSCRSTGFAVMTAHERRHLWQARKVMGGAWIPKAIGPSELGVGS
jgi:hypothetical protein